MEDMRQMLRVKLNHIYCGDCEKVLADFPSECIDLIVTSPPYADRRQSTYGGVSPDDYK